MDVIQGLIKYIVPVILFISGTIAYQWKGMENCYTKIDGLQHQIYELQDEILKLRSELGVARRK